MWLVAGCRRLRFHGQRLDVIDGQDGGRDEPGQAEDGADDDKEGDDEQVQMITASFLLKQNAGQIFQVSRVRNSDLQFL